MSSYIIDISRFFNENFTTIWWIALFLGSWTLLAETYRFAYFIYAKLIRKRKNYQQRYGKGTWALITGSSEGIGKQFALSLAKQGFNIILSARTQSKLKQAQQQIKYAYPSVQVKYIVIDLSKSADKQQIESTWYTSNKLSQLDIGIVVNNAGVDYLNKIMDVPLNQLVRLIEIDCFVVNSIQYLFMEKWAKQWKQQKKDKKKRLLINVSSLCAQMPITYFSVYNAAKIYVDRLTQACAMEYPQIDFITLRPSEVRTKMTAFKKDIFTLQPYQCVQALLDDAGYQVISHGHGFHAIQGWLYSILPKWLFNLIWQGVVVKEFQSIRNKYKQENK